MSRAQPETPAPTTPPAATLAQPGTRKARIEAMLVARGIAPTWDAPPVTEIRTAGPMTGRLVGDDVRPGYEYVRVNASQSQTIARYMERGYALVNPDHDVRLDNCTGPDDVMMMAPSDLVAKARAMRQARRKGRRAGAQQQANYKSSEGAWKPPAT